MATIDQVLPVKVAFEQARPTNARKQSALWERALAPLASLRLTVVLFALANLLILAGTLAQVDKDIWQVIEEYFRTPVTWIALQLFFPRTWFPEWQSIPGGFWFPGGYVIGGLMSANLIAAHLLRFRIQARGSKLLGGLALSAVGIALTALVIVSGSNSATLQTEPAIPYPALWKLLKGSYTLAWATGTIGLGWMSLGAFSGPTHRGRALVTMAAVVWAIVTASVIWLYTTGSDFVLSDSAMRILWQLTQGGIGGVVLLAGCGLLFGPRAGIVLLHGGIGLMMVGELLTGVAAVEAQLNFSEGETINYLQDIRTIELAVIDRSGPETDQVTVVPRNILLASAKNFDPRPMWQRVMPRSPSTTAIDHPSLPFKIELVSYLPNAGLRDAGPQEPNPATTGMGTKLIAVDKAASTGTDNDSKVDFPAVYAKFTSRDGVDLGTRLLAVQLAMTDQPEKIAVASKTYDVALRFERHYRPYEVTLLDARKDDYVGTSTPRNYSSDIKLVDPSRDVDREVHIWMNNPLRFAGETFYQSGYNRDQRSGIEYSTLQVVKNTGWMIPYVSCMLVAIGMLAHFTITLTRFAQRLREGRAFALPQHGSTTLADATAPSSKQRGKAVAAAPSSPWLLIAPGLALLVAGGLVASGWRAAQGSAASGELNLTAFGDLPVVDKGRIKPFDSLARITLLSVSNADTFKDTSDKTQSATRWLLDVIAKTQTSLDHQVFKIENLEVQQLLGLERRKGYRYAYGEFGTKLEALMVEARKANEIRQASPNALSPFQRKVLELTQRLRQFDTLAEAFAPPEIRRESAMEDIATAIRRSVQFKDDRQPPLAVPPSKDENDDWETFSEAWLRDLVRTGLQNQPAEAATSALTSVLVEYAKDNPTEFNRAIEKYQQVLADSNIKDLNLDQVRFEGQFNRLQPFTLSFRLYVIAFAVGLIGWLGMTSPTWMRSVGRAALMITLVALLVHTAGLVGRIYISGRPPVTNLYSAAVFVGWGAAVLALGFEWVSRMGIGPILAGAIGAGTLTVAGYLGNDGDTFTVLQAVLDTQFWLSTHVTCITFGYATTYVAGFLGVIYVMLGTLTPRLTPSIGKEITRMTYGSLCFSIFFSFVGTVLGGLWADDSWGRFLGWDPKENGALMIVLWNALCLHARWGAMVKDRGLALLSIAGNIVVTWSFFGTNQLGVGLHSYGATEGGLRAMFLFMFSQFAIILMGLLPLAWWWSNRRANAITTKG